MRTLLFNQITSLSSAVGLGQGLSRVASVVPAYGGSGYSPGDLITVTDDAGTANTFVVPATLRVKTVNSNGGVLTLDVVNGGVATAKPGAGAATSGGTGTGLTLTITWADNAVPNGVQAVRMTAEGQTVRWRDDGTAPTAAIGHTIAVGSMVEVSTGSIGSIKVIEATSGAKLNVSFLVGG